jgi:biotin carboxylase
VTRVAVVVDPYSSGNLFAPAFRAAGLRPVAVTSAAAPAAVYAASYRPGDFDLVLNGEGGLDGVVGAVRGLDPVCVLPGTESGVELADQLAAAVTPGQANVPALAAARRHKAAMSRAVAAAGLPTIRQICTASAAEVAGWLDRSGLAGRDLVVKPPKSAGSDGVCYVPAGADWRPAFAALLGERNKLDLVNDQVLVQEYVTGTEYVVDTFSHDGRHTVVDICQYRKIHNAGQMAVYDSMRWLPHAPAEHGELLAYTTAVLDAIGVRFGAAHSEVMMTADGPRLLETGVRPHGGGHPLFCRVATGDSQVDRTVRYCTGATDLPRGFELRRHTMVVFLLSERTGTARNVEVYDRLRDLASYHTGSIAVRNGDLVRATTDLFSSLALGFVVLAHEDADQLDADYRQVRRIEAGLVVEPALLAQA